MYSVVINIAIDVNKAVLDGIILPAPELINPIVELSIADPDPIKISVTINNIFFLFIFLYFFLYYSLSVSTDFKVFSWSCFSV